MCVWFYSVIVVENKDYRQKYQSSKSNYKSTAARSVQIIRILAAVLLIFACSLVPLFSLLQHWQHEIRIGNEQAALRSSLRRAPL